MRVVIADDDALVRSGVRMLLEQVPGVEVVGEAADGDTALAEASRLGPDVVLMDLRMPGTDGISATRRITSDEFGTATGSTVRVLVLTTFDDEESVAGALRAGASGFLVKDSAAAALGDAVRAVAAGDSWLDPSTSGAVIRIVRRTPATSGVVAEALGRLTAREREVLAMVAQGLTNEEVGDQLVLSQATVRTHVSRILMKTGTHDRSQAVALAYQGGLVGRPFPRE